MSTFTILPSVYSEGIGNFYNNNLLLLILIDLCPSSYSVGYYHPFPFSYLSESVNSKVIPTLNNNPIVMSEESNLSISDQVRKRQESIRKRENQEARDAYDRFYGRNGKSTQRGPGKERRERSLSVKSPRPIPIPNVVEKISQGIDSLNLKGKQPAVPPPYPSEDVSLFRKDPAEFHYFRTVGDNTRAKRERTPSTRTDDALTSTTHRKHNGTSNP
ncbi:hypothetical protein EYC80_006693 [Monilinia laxa]|uniref:Uncharacterized protein n=1 Tax=Monilinia laxa TaxID=61186 RepID=A0A5N6JYX0_MONLA|nr:hypothetical protein EYC80_006693 [Monilinia laxa]